MGLIRFNLIKCLLTLLNYLYLLKVFLIKFILANKFVIFLALLALTRLFLDAILVFLVIFWIPTNNASNAAWMIANCAKVLINAKPVMAISFHWLHSQNRALSVINQIKNYLLWNYAIFVMIIVKFVIPPLDAKLVTIS